MSDQKISQLSTVTKATIATADLFPVVQTSGSTTKSITYGELIVPQSNNFRIADNTDTSKKVAFDISGITSATTRTIIVPDANDTMVTIAASQTLTNKTLTTPVINVGSDSTGDLYYRNSGGAFTRLPIGSNLQILQSNGTTPSWVANPSASNASTTVAGIVEQATSSEITAGTATGGSGAPLFMSPDQFAASAPTFSGANITNLPSAKIIAQSVTPATTSVADTNEHTVITSSLPGGTLGTAGVVRVTVRGTWAGSTGGRVLTMRLKIGSTSVNSPVITDGTTSLSGFFVWTVDIYANASTASQRGRGTFMMYATSSTFGAAGNQVTIADSQSASEDSTGTLSITITSQLNSASNPPALTVDNYSVQKL